MDLSTVRFLGLNLVEWASILAVVVAIPPLMKAFSKRRSEEPSCEASDAPRLVELPSPVRDGQTSNVPIKDGQSTRISVKSGRLAESVDKLSKAIVVAPVAYAASSVAADVMRDKFSDAALDAAASSASHAAVQVAGDLAVPIGATALDPDLTGLAPDGSGPGDDSGILDTIMNIIN
jgi:hypothetical protein